MDILDRVADKVLIGDGCWEWIGGLHAAGYGQVGIGGKRQALAHRVIYELFIGPIGDGLTIDGGVAAAQFIPDQRSNSVAQRVHARKLRDELGGMSIKHRA